MSATTVRLRCDLCDDHITSTPDQSHMDAIDHVIDHHRVEWLADGPDAADRIRVAP